ncbi:Mitochondrial import inner membrane translocase subunit TIM16 [Wickerhamomyces ciferrii]|uniref:Mitochondrial import inner membrane translocase subunit TIM16 n=1 Tax=Wickerhamomyces ciferrii (strain ATCC 14091 / BCRC 22168 / CBS 111 / JCM 3599 / NBRC 0793 / NRRL Y-1031 F-60-10) TaxID=1206466 RepID=K0KU31_WICCF|nr:Mitochondrial import inner membrane translocase subunit TIM16 [Wickerhamomyces ciferrii]CCH45537.1 Mitochondrial import inner membrane translocase subunit TIM16 [Wickerhamomyces ciferrii]
MAHRLIVQVIFTGAQVFGRAFTEAYRQAATQTAKQSSSSTAKAARDFGITLDESSKILDVDLKNVTLDKIDEKYNYLFDVNGKEKANSFYLQSKVYWAAERLKGELKAKEEAKNAKSETKEEGTQDQPKA